jgi:hypothetical protein
VRLLVDEMAMEEVLIRVSLGLPYESFRPHKALGFTQPLSEMSTRNIKKKKFLGSKVWLVRGADNLTVIYEPIA